MAYDEALAFACALAREAGQTMISHFRTDDARPTYKAANNPVTIVDTTINRMVIERVRSAYPTCGVIGEEESYESDREYIWMVDPLDGTLPYTIGLPIACFILALVINGRPVIAVTYNPWSDLIYTAIKGRGAFCNNEQLQMSEPHTRIVECMLWKGSSHRDRLVHLLSDLESANFSPQNFAGGISRMALSEDRLYGVIYADDHGWDCVALDLVIHEAGGLVTDLDGNEIDYRKPLVGCVAAAPAQHQQLLEYTKSI